MTDEEIDWTVDYIKKAKENDWEETNIQERLWMNSFLQLAEAYRALQYRANE